MMSVCKLPVKNTYYESKRLLYGIIKDVVNKVTQGVFKCIKLLNFLESVK